MIPKKLYLIKKNLNSLNIINPELVTIKGEVVCHILIFIHRCNHKTKNNSINMIIMIKSMPIISRKNQLLISMSMKVLAILEKLREEIILKRVRPIIDRLIQNTKNHPHI